MPKYKVEFEFKRKHKVRGNIEAKSIAFLNKEILQDPVAVTKRVFPGTEKVETEKKQTKIKKID